MNTPKSRKPKRWLPSSYTKHDQPDGSYSLGLWAPTNPNALESGEIALFLGRLIALWNHVEDDMIQVLGDLLGTGYETPARQVFKSIASNQARQRLMVSLLERAKLNKDKGPLYDRLIDDFYTLNGVRNKFVHGLWYVHQDGGVYLSEESLDTIHFLHKREIKLEELHRVWNRMMTLMNMIEHRHRPNWVEVPNTPNKKVQRKKRA